MEYKKGIQNENAFPYTVHREQGHPGGGGASFNVVGSAHCLGMSYYVTFWGGLGSNEFHIK